MKQSTTGQETPARLLRNFSMERDGRKGGRKEGREGQVHDLGFRKKKKKKKKKKRLIKEKHNQHLLNWVCLLQ